MKEGVIKMNFLSKITLILVFVFFVSETKANTLLDSLKSAYLNNPKLNAERASMRASIEEKREAILKRYCNSRCI